MMNCRDQPCHIFKDKNIVYDTSQVRTSPDHLVSSETAHETASDNYLSVWGLSKVIASVFWFGLGEKKIKRGSEADSQMK